MKDYYLILDISPYATQEEIKSAYKKMSLKYHPDTNKEDKYFEERFKDIKEAFDELSDLNKRKEYDYKRFAQNRNKDEYNIQKEILHRKEVELNEKEKALDIIEINLKQREGILNSTSKKNNNKWYGVFIPIIGFLILMAFLYEKNRENKISELETSYNELLNKHLASINRFGYFKDSINAVIIIKENSIAKFKEIINKSNIKGEELSEKDKSNKEINIKEKKIGKYIVLKNYSEVELIDFIWVQDWYRGAQYIDYFSVFNKTDKELLGFELDWIVEDRNQTPLDYGTISYGKSTGYKSEFPVLPKLAKKIIAGMSEFEGLVSIEKNQRIVLIIKNVEFE